MLELVIERALLTLTQADGRFQQGPLSGRRPPTWRVTGGTLRYRYLAVAQGSRGLGPEGRISDTMSHAAGAGRHAWIKPAVEDLGGGLCRIPLPLPLDGLKAVNVYAITDPGGVDLIDAGMAMVAAGNGWPRAVRQLGYELGISP